MALADLYMEMVDEHTTVQVCYTAKGSSQSRTLLASIGLYAAGDLIQASQQTQERLKHMRRKEL